MRRSLLNRSISGEVIELKKTSFKAKNICVVMTFTVAVLFFFTGLWQIGLYKKLKNNCTCTTTGVVATDGKKSRTQEYIEVETDQYFSQEYIYASNRAEKKGDEVIIHYDKNNTENYYINDRVNEYKVNAYFIFLMSVFMLMLTIFLAIVIRKQFKKLQSRKK